MRQLRCLGGDSYNGPQVQGCGGAGPAHNRGGSSNSRAPPAVSSWPPPAACSSPSPSPVYTSATGPQGSTPLSLARAAVRHRRRPPRDRSPGTTSPQASKFVIPLEEKHQAMEEEKIHLEAKLKRLLFYSSNFGLLLMLS